ncbi:hypothetical protein D3C72_1204910 [compost metagenome]
MKGINKCTAIIGTIHPVSTIFIDRLLFAAAPGIPVVTTGILIICLQDKVMIKAYGSILNRIHDRILTGADHYILAQSPENIYRRRPGHIHAEYIGIIPYSILVRCIHPVYILCHSIIGCISFKDVQFLIGATAHIQVLCGNACLCCW